MKKIVILVEGQTEQAFKKVLNNFLRSRLPNKMPKLDFKPAKGSIPKEDNLRRKVEYHLKASDVIAVIALTDVYGTDFKSGQEAKQKMRQWVDNEPKFHPHVALHDFEAWLIPYWPTIQELAGHNKHKPGDDPEKINHNKPPSYHVKEIFEAGTRRVSYSKPRDGLKILENQDLLVSANACPELKSFLNTILGLSGGELIP